jgi:DNA-binding NtrC family response regulator
MNRNLQSVKRRFGIIGRSQVLDNALSTAVRVASTDLTVLIQGESGVGKEVFSRIIHELSPRKHNKFIAINCGAIPEGTINSELFGHEKGAFTGATSERKGYFETVDGGTIFLDEIAEMPLDTQAFLLRILESGEFMRVGSSKVLRTDVRVIAATNVDLEEKIRTGKFREDLFYRLNTVPISVPALRERKEDIYMLFRKFAVDFAEKHSIKPIQLDEDAKLLLKNYTWPGNIRELKNLAEQISILSEDRHIGAEELLEQSPKMRERNLPASSLKEENTRSYEEREILYKLLFEMKSDLTELKRLVFGLISNNDLSVPEKASLPTLSKASEEYFEDLDANMDMDAASEIEVGPVLLDKEQEKQYQESEIVEESLSLEDMEKEMIKKALKKHNGKRKDAAEDLGISERTLYRKIKQYDL